MTQTQQGGVTHFSGPVAPWYEDLHYKPFHKRSSRSRAQYHV